MESLSPDIGFSYFSTKNRLIEKERSVWLATLKDMGARFLVFKAGFDLAIPEDVISDVLVANIIPVIHFNRELPSVKDFRNITILLSAYAKWGVKWMIFGNESNMKYAWPVSGWHYENLVDHYIDRFVPLACHAIKSGIKPFLSPMRPGGDYWDTAFVELTLTGLKQRKLDEILNKLGLTSYGYTYGHPFDWGKGGPEQWSEARPYQLNQNSEDQIGFTNYEWVSLIAKKTIGKMPPILILDCGNDGRRLRTTPEISESVIWNVQNIYRACSDPVLFSTGTDKKNLKILDNVIGCGFNLDTLSEVSHLLTPQDPFSPFHLHQILDLEPKTSKLNQISQMEEKLIPHYLLLPRYESGVSDAILNKVRPFIKRYLPTVGFALEEALLAKKVTVYHDLSAISEEVIDRLHAAGCHVEILPDSGIEIATNLNGSTL